MDLKLTTLVLVLCLNLSSAKHRYQNYIYEDSKEDYEYDYANNEDQSESEVDDDELRQPDIDQRLQPNIQPRYEVTENVDDVPNPMEFKPIVTNFSIAKPLNLAATNNTTTSSNTVTPTPNNTPNKRPVNIVNVVNENGQQFTHQDIFNFHDLINKSVQGLTTGLVNGIKKLGKDLAEVPGFLINNIQRRGNGVVKRVHSYFDHDHEDEFHEY